jgi:hypothetical protein
MFKGAKYEETKSLLPREVAQRIRQDIKDDGKAGQLPRGLRVTVRVEHYRSIYITVRRLGDGMDSVLWDRSERLAWQTRLAQYAEAYNMDDSRIEIDHFNCRFYVHVTFSAELFIQEVVLKKRLSSVLGREPSTGEIAREKDAYVPDPYWSR